MPFATASGIVRSDRAHAAAKPKAKLKMIGEIRLETARSKIALIEKLFAVNYIAENASIFGS